MNWPNSLHSYGYATCSDVLEQVNATLVKYGISTIAISELLRMERVTTAKDNEENLVIVKTTIMLIDSESGETISIAGLGRGQGSGDKAILKAQTAAMKYAYLLSFGINTSDKPESNSRRNTELPNSPAIKPNQRHMQKML